MKPDQPREPRYEFGKESTRVMDDELVQTLAQQSREGEALPPTTQVEVLTITDDGVVFDEPPTVPKIREAVPVPEPPAPASPAPAPAPGGRQRSVWQAGAIASVGALLLVGLGHHEPVRVPAPSTINVLGVFALPARMAATLDRARSWLEAARPDDGAVVKGAEPDPVDNTEHGVRTKHHHRHRG